MNYTGNEAFLTPEEMAAKLRISLRTLQKMMKDGIAPKFIRLGHRVLFVTQCEPTQTPSEHCSKCNSTNVSIGPYFTRCDDCGFEDEPSDDENIPPACSHCGSFDWVVVRPGAYRCQSCGKSFQSPSSSN